MGNRPDPRKLVEAALFLSPRPLSLSELSKIAGVPPEDVRTILDDLSERYKSIESALVVERFTTAVRLYVSPEVFPHVKDLAAVPEFSQRELEVVAHIAMKGAVLRSELRKMYSGADKVIDKLRSLGAVVLRRKGRTYEVKKTELFDRYFGVSL